jgi:predicted kinase
MKPILAVMIGISGSGKSTFANGLKTSIGAELIETDAIREELTGDAADQSQNYRVFQIAKQRVSSLLSQGKNVIIDATSVSEKDRKDWVEIGKKNNAELRAYFVNVPVEVAKKRNKSRTRQVPEDVIDRQSSRLQVPRKEEGFDYIKVI